MLKIVGLGPGDYNALTIGVLNQLKKNKNIYFRTEKHPTVDFLKEQGIIFNTYDHAYEMFDSFDNVYEYIANDIIKNLADKEEIIYGVPGHPLVAEKSVLNLIELCKKNSIEYKLYPAVSFIDAIMEALKIDPIEGIKIIDAFDINNQIIDKRIGCVITQVYNKFIASEVKIKLLEGYNEDTEIFFVRAVGIEGLESIRKIPLYELDWQEDIDYLTSIYIPKDLNNKKDFYDFVDLIDTLRGEDGCPWDSEQTHKSIKRNVIEESFEVLDAIEKEDENALIEELGDVLLQVIFHSSIGKEDGYFDINDVIQGIYNKMLYRHPHVFKDVKISSAEEVLDNWDEIKQKEKGSSTLTEEMKSIADALPALIIASKVQNKAKKVGFDFDSASDAIKKIEEELDEVKDVYKDENKSRIEEELGDLLFSCVNLSRLLNIDCEEALRKTIKKFIARFSYMEKKTLEKHKFLKDLTLEQMDELWNEAKNFQ